MSSANKLLMIRSPLFPGLAPADTVSEDRFFKLPRRPILCTITHPINPKHFSKFWVLAFKVAQFHPRYMDADDAVRDVKRKLGMFTSWHEEDGKIWCDYESISPESMDGIAFTAFYEKALATWAAEIGCDPEELLK